MHVVFGVKADLVDGGGEARYVLDEASIYLLFREVSGLLAVATLLVEAGSDLAPAHLLGLTKACDKLVLGVVFGVAADTGLLVLGLEDGNVVLNLAFDGAGADKGVHGERVPSGTAAQQVEVVFDFWDEERVRI